MALQIKRKLPPLFEKRLGDEMSLLKRDIAVATKPDSTPSGQKGSQK